MPRMIRCEPTPGARPGSNTMTGIRPGPETRCFILSNCCGVMPMCPASRGHANAGRARSKNVDSETLRGAQDKILRLAPSGRRSLGEARGSS